MKIPTLFFALLLAFSGLAIADDAPIIYSRDTIRILPVAPRAAAPAPETQPEAVEKKPDADSDASAETKSEKPDEPEKPAAPSEPKTKELTVDIRPESILYQQNMFTFNPFANASGLLIWLGSPKQATLETIRIFSAVDILYMASDGKIVQIVPSIVPSEIAEPITTSKPVIAMLLLQAGECEKLDILPGDRVEHALFKAKPKVLESD